MSLQKGLIMLLCSCKIERIINIILNVVFKNIMFLAFYCYYDAFNDQNNLTTKNKNYYLKIHPRVKRLDCPVMVFQPSKAVDEVGAECGVNVIRSKLSLLRPVVGPCSPITDNLTNINIF